MNISSQTDVGRQKEINEDVVVTDSFGATQVLIVADGMGGHSAGDVASKIAARIMKEYISESLQSGAEEYENILAKGIRLANDSILQTMRENEINSMGTTMLTAITDSSTATITNVGDSRAYTIGESIEQITEDQMFVDELGESGEISPEAAKDSFQRNVLSQALGANETLDPDFYTSHVPRYFLLCSDGLTNEISEETICNVVKEANSVNTATSALIKKANKNGGRDNISVILAGHSD